MTESSAASFHDHFSASASAYAEFRPRYPTALLRQLAELAPQRRLAWDCATGNGQAAIALGEFFEKVIATDASAEQIARAIPHPHVEYRVARAEASGLALASVDLVCVAQALHWLDVEAFHREAERVLVPGGVLAEIAYDRPVLPEPLDAVLLHFYRDVVGPYWPTERRHIESGYVEIPFPFERLPIAAPPMEGTLSLAAFAGYVGTWSAVQRYRAVRGEDPLPGFMAQIAPMWGTGAQHLTWPVTVRAGYAPRTGASVRNPPTFP